jgi:hypothetical protein
MSITGFSAAARACGRRNAVSGLPESLDHLRDQAAIGAHDLAEPIEFERPPHAGALGQPFGQRGTLR